MKGECIMIFKEPKVEFESINLQSIATASDTGGGQRCIGTQPEATTCADFDTQTPW